ncbi:ATP synthase F0F1, subunit [Dinoroseobacter shibae DFL 12 = DSM 16493]|jgi:ATP synthase protein I|uniref:ATP synthase F0F1, subunit n=1 Tax=Dinoroseobacter shibae (strain DSM 16493 / NCIMB 14021 / DFL 12) TaxID=398580 RepID=A8LN41_DINSH|nr:MULTISPECIES: AtpZ/AtpI family protein [Dinoroseobacter]ABV92185.1 ATP synthase F0F1, subunit [Dinoroseobacter shibae DFL 12 = DSM 16493]MDD9717386.1 AtpZ/AtpI family protein [Dinoroseobacter sp. PD6]URF47139.1 AtpZ/AtpI family protein [Dinoroseobacter shibae]URF51450.1 AtpZ/AtpI family protein [Dinoroseobacter shibae]
MTQKPDRSAEDIGQRARRMKAARDDPGPSPLRGIGTFGMIGWSIAVPTVGGVFLGLWLDRVAPQTFSWTIALLLGGVVLGALIAWNWIGKEGDGR